MKIGVFDSGVGGLSVTNAIEKAVPDSTVIYIDDKDNLPYGDKSSDEIFKLVLPKMEYLVNQGCQVIVIACNTVSTTLAPKLRQIINVPLIAMEPMLKPAANLTKTGVITVCATPTTLSSERYQWLKSEYAKDIKVLEPDCSDWSYMIENDTVDRSKIQKIVEDTCAQNSDVIVLGCTHYHWIEDLINEFAKARAAVIQPEEAIVRQLKQVLEQLG